MQRQPLKISNRLMDELEVAYSSDELVDAFTLRRLANEVDKLLQVDAPSAYLGKALLAVLTWDVEGAKRHASSYLKLDASAAALGNVANVYRRIGEPAQAAEFFIQANAKAEQDLEFVQSIALELACLGRYRAAERMLMQLNQKTKNVEDMLDSIRDDMENIKNAGIDFSEIESQLDIAYSVAQRKKVVPIAYKIQSYIEGARRSVLASLLISGDEEMEYSLEYELGEKLSALPNWDPERLNIVFECR